MESWVIKLWQLILIYIFNSNVFHLCRHLNKYVDNPFIEIRFKSSCELQYKEDITNYTCLNVYMLIMFIKFTLYGILDIPHVVNLDKRLMQITTKKLKPCAC